jgi:ankyrin repeat protein
VASSRCADPHIALSNGNTALHLVAGLGWRDGSPAAPSYDQGTEEEAVATIDYLLELGLDLQVQNQGGDTPLHAAVSGRKSETIITHLLDLGADPLAENGRGQTPVAASARASDASASILSEAAK